MDKGGLEIELADKCECGFRNLNIWGTRMNGSLKLDVRCMRCGKPLFRVEGAGRARHICPACGVEDRKNRPERDLFRCIGCGYAGHADHVAAINIAARANVNRPIVSEDFFEHPTHLQGQAPQFSGG